MPLDGFLGLHLGTRPTLPPWPAARHFAVALGLATALACGSGGDATDPGDDDRDDAPGAIPEALVGSWRFQDAGDVLCDPGTGRCTSSYARSETLRLTSDGLFEHALFAESNFPPCRLVVLHEARGTADVEGSSLSLHILEGVTRVQDSCGESSDTDESDKTDVYAWSLSGDTGGTPQLMLTDDQGNEIGPFERQ